MTTLEVREAVVALDRLPLDLDNPAPSSPWRDLRSARDRLAVLALVTDGRRAWSLDTVASRLGIGRSAAHRHLRALAAAGLVRARPRRGYVACSNTEKVPLAGPRAIEFEDHQEPLVARSCSCPSALPDADGCCVRCGRYTELAA